MKKFFIVFIIFAILIGAGIWFIGKSNKNENSNPEISKENTSQNAQTNETKKSAEATVNAFIDVVTEALVKGDKVQLVGFGSFEVRKRAARKGRNPQTKEEIKIPASKAPVFKAGKALKDLVNKK